LISAKKGLYSIRFGFSSANTVDADPEPAYHLEVDADPDPADNFDADPNPTF
jgi:hypothetical protein